MMFYLRGHVMQSTKALKLEKVFKFASRALLKVGEPLARSLVVTFLLLMAFQYWIVRPASAEFIEQADSVESFIFATTQVVHEPESLFNLVTYGKAKSELELGGLSWVYPKRVNENWVNLAANVKSFAGKLPATPVNGSADFSDFQNESSMTVDLVSLNQTLNRVNGNTLDWLELLTLRLQGLAVLTVLLFWGLIGALRALSYTKTALVKKVIDTMPVGVFIVDRDGCFILMNVALPELLGVNPIKQNLSLNALSDYKYDKELKSGASIVDAMIQMRGKHLKVTTAPLDGGQYLGVISDFTGLQKSKQAQELLNKELESTQSMLRTLIATRTEQASITTL